MVELKDVSVTYSSGVDALHNVNLKINDGDFAFVVGASGAGKSTMIKLILKEINPTSGSIYVNGYNLNKLRRRRIPALRRTIGFVFQDFRLIPSMTVYENVAFVLRVIDAPTKYIRKRVPYVIGLVGLQDKTNAYPDELSGGEKQRVAIARALVNDPQLIIADEPTGNIDPALSFEIVDLLSEINRRGTTVLMVTHEHSLVKHFHKRIIQIHSGEIVADTAEMADVYAPPERYESPEEAVENDDDYAEYDNQETYEEDYPAASEPAAQEEYGEFQEMDAEPLEAGEEESAEDIAEEILREQELQEDSSEEVER